MALHVSIEDALPLRAQQVHIYNAGYAVPEQDASMSVLTELRQIYFTNPCPQAECLEDCVPVLHTWLQRSQGNHALSQRVKCTVAEDRIQV